MKTLLFCIFLNGFVLPKVVQAQESIPKKKYTTTSLGLEKAPNIDGIIYDQSWEKVAWSGGYIEWSPEENTEPVEQTFLKILYDDKNLYVAFKCLDKDSKGVVRRLSRRDGFDGDWVEINIDSNHDLTTAFSFTITAAGVKGEEFISNNGAFWDATWNPIWYAETNIDEEGWTAEIRIPLSQLRFGKADDQVWGIQSTRRYFRTEERSVWQRSPQNAAGWVSSFGELHGLRGLTPQKQIEIQPYAVSTLETYEAEAGNPFRDGSDVGLNAGIDGKIGITSDLKLDFTINPDFGQVEADPSAIALDGFQIFFPEQRPFFIESKNIFDYTFSQSKAWLVTGGTDNLFYSRRIGRSPQGFAHGGAREFTNQPDVTNILGAAKFSGKTSNGWSLGVLESITGREKAEIFGANTSREQTVEPLTHYFVGRVQKDFNGNNTRIGGILTSTNRDIEESVNFLHTNAYTGGVDVLHQWKNRAYYVKGNVVLSQVDGSKEAISATQQSITHLFQREDASHLNVDEKATSLAGSGGNLQFGKASGNWLFETGGTWRSPELELNDVGFQLRADDIRHYFWGQYRTTKPMKNARSFVVNYTQLGVHDFEGNLNEFTFRANGWVNLKNNWWINGGSIYSPWRYSTTALRGGPRLRRQDWYNYSVGIISDSRKKIRATSTFTYLSDIGADNDYWEINNMLTYQPTNALQVSVSPFYSENNKQLQYIATREFNGNRRYINGTINQQTLSFPLRIDYILKPNLSIQYWGQPYISRGKFSNIKFITNPTASQFEDRFEEYSANQFDLDNGTYNIDENDDSIIDYTFSQPDFAFVQFRSNLVLRWEYTPGSELFLVWSQDVSQFGDVNEGLFQSLENNIVNTKPQNIFLVKLTYRFIK